MRTVTATEASRSFAALLDEAEAGHSVLVTRGHRRVAVISPASPRNGADVRALLDASFIDPGFADDVRSGRDAASLDGPAWLAD